MAVIDEYLTKQNHALRTALAGISEEAEALSVISTTGLRGIGQLRHYSLNYEDHTLTEVMYTDTGIHTKVSKTHWSNGTALIIQTQARIYIVSKHFQPGTPLSMQDVRIIGPIKTDCALAIHTQHGRYDIIQSGTMQCWTHGISLAQISVDKGSILHRDDTDFCSNECIQLGFKGYMFEEKHMPTQPSIHPANMRQFIHDKMRGDQTTTYQMHKLENGHQMVHDQMAKDIRDSEDIIQEIRDEQDSSADVGLHAGVAGAVVSFLTVLSLLLICARCGWRRYKERGEAHGGGIELSDRQVLVHMY
jgi:hypothetical protein